MKMHLNYLDKCNKGGNRKTDFFVSFFFSFFSIMLMNLLADYNWKHLVSILTFSDSIITAWLCSCLCASQIEHQPLGKFNDYFKWILKPQMMCLAAYYSSAYSQCKASITGLGQSRWFLLMSEPLIFSCQDPAHSPLKLSELSSVSEGGRMVHMEDSGQVVSKSTFNNVSLFYTCSIWASSVVFPAVRKVWIKPTQLKEEGLALCATATDRPPLVFLYSNVWRCLLLCRHSFV